MAKPKNLEQLRAEKEQVETQLAQEQHMLSKRQYELSTGRRQKNDVIAYQIRQSFKPGEITAEEANKVGYELAMRFTKGKYAFIVATHTDREHIHNHIIYNSTALDSTRKFRDFLLSGLAVQRLSDLICLEHQLSVIEIKPYRERQKRTLYPPRESNRDMNAICDTTAKSETLSVKGCKVKITYAPADTDCLDAIQKLLQTTILRTAGHTAA